MERKKVAILISGRGSNMAALISASQKPNFPAQIVLVASNIPEAGGIEVAKQHNIDTEIINHKEFSTRVDFEKKLNDVLKLYSVDIVCCAGFMRLLTAGFVNEWHNKLMNIHPSLLPAYKGLHTHQRVIDDGGLITGCTVHLMRPDMDSGPIIIQAAVPVFPSDNEDELGARVLRAEHKIYPFALEMLAKDELSVSGNKVNFNNTCFSKDEVNILFSPNINLAE